MEQENIFREENIRKVLEKPATADFARPKNKEMLLRMRINVVNVEILLMPIFCQCQDSVDANILSTPIFFQCRDFVNAEIL